MTGRLHRDGGGYTRYTWGHVVVNNRHGFRERDFVVPKPQGVFRIMVLGDSLTWGQGLGVKERYTNLPEYSLRQSLPAKRYLQSSGSWCSVP